MLRLIQLPKRRNCSAVRKNILYSIHFRFLLGIHTQHYSIKKRTSEQISILIKDLATACVIHTLFNKNLSQIPIQYLTVILSCLLVLLQ